MTVIHVFMVDLTNCHDWDRAMMWVMGRLHTKGIKFHRFVSDIGREYVFLTDNEEKVMSVFHAEGVMFKYLGNYEGEMYG